MLGRDLSPGWPQWLTLGSQGSSAGLGPRRCWSKAWESGGVTWPSHQREVGPGCPLISSAGGARRRLRPHSLSFLTIPPFCTALVLQAFRETACRVKAQSGLQVLGQIDDSVEQISLIW